MKDTVIGIEYGLRAAGALRSADALKALREECSALAAGACIHDDGLTADESGTPYCAIKRELGVLKRSFTAVLKGNAALVIERSALRNELGAKVAEGRNCADELIRARATIARQTERIDLLERDRQHQQGVLNEMKVALLDRATRAPGGFGPVTTTWAPDGTILSVTRRGVDGSVLEVIAQAKNPNARETGLQAARIEELEQRLAAQDRHIGKLAAKVAMVAAEEREACAELADKHLLLALAPCERILLRGLSDAIRARGVK